MSKKFKDAKDTVAKLVSSVDAIDEVEVDHDFSRDAYKQLIEHGLELLPEIMNLAKDSEHPRAFEVAFHGMKLIGDTTDKLLNLHRKKQLLDDGKGPDDKPIDGGFGKMDMPASGEHQPRLTGPMTSAELLNMIQDTKKLVAEDADFDEIPKSKKQTKESD